MSGNERASVQIEPSYSVAAKSGAQVYTIAQTACTLHNREIARPDDSSDDVVPVCFRSSSG